MAKSIKEVSTFPAGTTEEEMRAVREMRLKSGIVDSCEYEGDEPTGWEMTTVWRF